MILILILCSHLNSAIPVPGDESPKEGVLFVLSLPELGTYVIRGSEEKMAYYPQGIHIAPRISPDRSALLLHLRRGGRIGIWLGDIEGKNLRRICDGDQADWSPDGGKILFRREGRIVQRDLATGEEESVSSPELSDCRFPSYLSEDRFLFVCQDSIYLKEETSPDAKILATGEIGSAPRASADGVSVAWQDGAHLSLIDLRTGKSTQLTRQGGIQSWPVWSDDGEYVAYSQSPNPSGPWDLYVTQVEDPEEISLVRRNIHPNFDWCGPYAPEAGTSTMVPSTVRIDSSESGDSSLRNRWLSADYSPEWNEVRIFWAGAAEKDHSLQISARPADPAPQSKPRIQFTFRIRDKTQLSPPYAHVESSPSRVTFSLFEHRPLIELQTTGVSSVLLDTKVAFALLPDRLGNDILVDPRTCDSSKVALPYTPVFLAPLSGGSGTLMIITPDSGQKIELRSGPDAFERIILSPGSKSVFLALLEGADYFREVPVRSDAGNDAWQVEWTHPFLAQWRFLAVENGHGYSGTWTEEGLNLAGPTFLPINSSSPPASGSAVVYLFGRSWRTPLDVLTPSELVVDALGVEPGYRLLDERGIRAYRTARGPVTFRAITSREEEWSRELVHVDSRDPNWVELGVLESMQGLRAVDTPGVRALIEHFGKDIAAILEGLEDRIKEYRDFLSKLREFCRSSALRTEDAGEFLLAVDRQAGLLEEKMDQMPISANREVSTALEAVTGALGPGNYLHGTKEYGRLSKVVRVSQEERLEVTGVAREFVKNLRVRAGRAVVCNSELKVVADEVRSMTQQILRNRYYLEGDWGGETPLREDTD